MAAYARWFLHPLLLVVADGEFIGRSSVWPDLEPGVVDANHIGHAVRPSRRRKGHATAMLAAALPIAFDLDIDPVVLVCTETNIGSRRVIERNHGSLAKIRDGRCHYQISAGDGSQAVESA